MSNKKEKKIKTTRKLINSFGVDEGEIKNSIIEYESSAKELQLAIENKGPKLLVDIINKIDFLLNEIDNERLKKAKFSELGVTLKSLIQAYHFLQLHFDPYLNGRVFLEDRGNQTGGENENVLESVSEIILRNKRSWNK